MAGRRDSGRDRRPRPSIPHERVMAEVEAMNARLKAGHPIDTRRDKRRDDVVTSESRRRDLSVTKTNPGALTPVFSYGERVAHMTF